jgi:hypothetical protein
MGHGMTGVWDASQFAPKQIGEGHPVGKFPFQISHTEITPTKDQTGGMFIVTFKTPAGEIPMRYNLWNQSAKAVEIAHGQLSALCHATGVFRLDWQNDGAALRGAGGMIEVGYQKGEEPSAEKPTGGYTEVKKVYDKNGNEPGKAPQAVPQPQQGWTKPAEQTPQPQPGQGGGWQNAPGATQQPQPQPNPAPGGWQQQPQTQNPPWKT